MGTGIGSATVLTAVLIFLLKVLFVLFIVSLFVGLAVSVKKYFFTEEDIKKIKSTFTGKKSIVLKEICSECGKEIETEWKACPYCGKSKEEKTTDAA